MNSRLPFPARGLYVITREGYAGPDALLAEVDAAIRGGAAVVQYRDKSALGRDAVALRLLTLCRAAGVPLIVNDNVDLAARIGADGVHLGRDDAGPAAARARLGADAIVGVSCYDSLERAVAAERAGASYAAFGRFFPSGSKPGATPARPEVLTLAAQRLSIPVVAIGGITAENGAGLLAAGASVLAVIEAVFGTDDPAAAAGRFRALFPAA